MKNLTSDVKTNAVKTQNTVSRFFNTFLIAFGSVFVVHLVGSGIYAFYHWNLSLVVSGFDFGSWSASARAAILIPYLLLPLVVAGVHVAGFSLTDWFYQLIKNKGTSQADD